jgi:hypothetical protein
MIADTNAASPIRWALSASEVLRHTTVGDDRAILEETFRTLGACLMVFAPADSAPMVGRLHTRSAAAGILGVGMKFLDEPALAHGGALAQPRSEHAA